MKPLLRNKVCVSCKDLVHFQHYHNCIGTLLVHECIYTTWKLRGCLIRIFILLNIQGLAISFSSIRDTKLKLYSHMTQFLTCVKIIKIPIIANNTGWYVILVNLHWVQLKWYSCYVQTYVMVGGTLFILQLSHSFKGLSLWYGDKRPDGKSNDEKWPTLPMNTWNSLDTNAMPMWEYTSFGTFWRSYSDILWQRLCTTRLKVS